MSVTPPVHADVLPVGPSIDDPDNFDPEADAFVADLRPFGIQMNALSDNVYANALAVQAFASAADASAQSATTSAGQALTNKTAAVQAAQDAGGYAQAAADSAAAAAGSSTSLTANSATAVVLGNGTKVFAVPAGKQFPPGELVQVGSTGTPAARMFGTVASYVGTTLTITTTKTQGPAATYSDWVIAPAGADGAPGGTAGGQLTGALDELKGTAPASSATPDIWNAGGNYVPITQTATITGLPNAPQAGAKRTLKAESTFPITSSTNFFVHGGSTVINPGDELDIVADTVSKFLVTVRRNDGSAAASFHNVELLLSSQVWTAKVTGPTKITLVAAAGSGGLASGNLGKAAAASGGSSGAIVIKTFYAIAGNTYTLLLGAFGVGVGTLSGGGITQDGNNAGQSSFVGNGVNVVAGGGKAGVGVLATSGNAVALGAVGGVGSGGDINIPGSNSGTATSALGNAAATGGAASPYRGLAVPSGSATATSTTNNRCAASGGAGVGGKSGDVVANTVRAASSGGGYASASANATDAVSTAVGAGLAAPSVFGLVITPLNLGSAGQPAQGGTSGTTAADLGAGSGGVVGSSTLTTAASRMLGGSGAVACSGSSAIGVIGSGSVNYGGASGGAAMSAPSSGDATNSGDGGAAFAIIETI
jgi:hypothetical protein